MMIGGEKSRFDATAARTGTALATRRATTLAAVAVLGCMLAWSASALAEPATTVAAPTSVLPDVNNPSGVSSAMQMVALVTILSVAPAVLVLVTCFTRIVVVLGLLRTALATQQLPPNQVLFGLALLMTVVVMGPVAKEVHSGAIEPLLAGKMQLQPAMDAAAKPVRQFMIGQIEGAGNDEDVRMFLTEDMRSKKGLTWRDVPTPSLISGFVVSELKVAFTMGFRIFLPFLIIDMLVASVLVSMGMLMMPPSLVSLPFKLLLFVLADGWHWVVGTLMRSFG